MTSSAKILVSCFNIAVLMLSVSVMAQTTSTKFWFGGVDPVVLADLQKVWAQVWANGFYGAVQTRCAMAASLVAGRRFQDFYAVCVAFQRC